MTGPKTLRPGRGPGEEPPFAAAPWRQRIYTIIFEADTPAGWAFDLALIATILISVFLVSFETIAALSPQTRAWLRVGEWVVTVLFTAEYVLRLLCIRRPARYARSFFGMVDLLSILPAYMSLVVPGSRYLLVVRVLRLLRIFRVLTLTRFLDEAHVLGRALRASAHKISVFLLAVLTVVVIVGSIMYIVEGETGGFTSIPRSMYWAIVTLTTVGYGDIAPRTPVGQALASFVMILGYGILAVPTGIVTVELAQTVRGGSPGATQAADSALLSDACRSCGAAGHAVDAVYCRRCGARL